MAGDLEKERKRTGRELKNDKSVKIVSLAKSTLVIVIINVNCLFKFQFFFRVGISQNDRMTSKSLAKLH